MAADISPVAVPPRIEHALRLASRTTGVDFDYLLDTAIRESGLKTNAKSKSSSASGLFQFIENTWLGMIKSAGAVFGLGRLAEKIEQTPEGRYEVADRSARQEILALRNDPRTAAVMAGVYTRDAEQALELRLGRRPSHGELYMAHFLGAGGASRLIETAAVAPRTIAAELFPQAAAANRGIFYGADGEPRTVDAVYRRLAATHEQGPLRLAGAAVAEKAAQPVISPAAATYLRPVNFAAERPENGLAWGRSLFAPPPASDAGWPGRGPLVLDSARLVALIEENPAHDHGVDGRNVGAPAGIRPAAERGTAGLLGDRSPFVSLFRTG